ncbi:venom serine protease 34 isoform X2 [Episyrphus balteatus]|uniref:venom serine protease 34 isoform X2 n=1 Tax=Episyrphus balteatus TaxID=286459 RepID=UPI0024854075|nr:venom serine protease 34 isoform X2 [Episyrphus balteatus]
MNSRNASIVFVLVLWSQCFPSNGLFENCNHVLELKPDQKLYINSPYYPNSYPRGTSCRYTVQAPIDFEIKFGCEIDFSSFNKINCNSDIFYFNNEGSEVLYGSEYFCGSGRIEKKSFINKATISYISSSVSQRIIHDSNSSQSGRFSCLVEVIEPPCDCGWSSTERVTGGSAASLGEFPSMAAVVRKFGNNFFCGATIIHHRYLLSAAHCFIAQEVSLPELIKIVVGEDDLSATSSTTLKKL